MVGASGEWGEDHQAHTGGGHQPSHAAGPVYSAADVDAYVHELHATIEALSSEVEQCHEQLDALRSAYGLIRTASERADATLAQARAQAEARLAPFGADAPPPPPCAPSSSAPDPQVDRSYFESLRRRVRSTDDGRDASPDR